MRIRNEKADSLIEEAAMKEFLEYGYKDASLRRIAAAAGITIGSIYARYRNKDELFCSLTQCVIDETGRAFEKLKPIYYAANSMEDMMKAMQAEMETTIHILFNHYDAAVILLCRSEGSSAGLFFDELKKRKISESEKFFSDFPKSEDLKHAMDVLITAQFDMYRQILKNGYTREEAENCMKVLTHFINGGWIAIMEELLKERGV